MKKNILVGLICLFFVQVNYSQIGYINTYETFRNVPDNGIGVVDEVVLNHASMGSVNVLTIGTQNTTPGDYCDVEFKKSTFHAHLSLGDNFNYGEVDFNLKINLEVSFLDNQSTVISSSNQVLEIQQDHAGLSEVEAYFQEDWTGFQNDVHTIEVKASYIGASAGVDLSDLQINAFFNREKAVKVNQVNVTQTSLFGASISSNPLVFNWSSACTDPTYEVQILKLFNVNENKVLDEKEVEAVVNWDQAISIYTESKDQLYSMTFPYGKGYYLWRVRPIGNFYSANGLSDSRDWGDWSSNIPNGAVVGFNSNGTIGYTSGTTTTLEVAKSAFHYDGIENDKNWIYSRSFADEGKLNESMTYANKIGQVKQAQAISPTTGKVIASKSLYDYSGAEAGAVMAAPIQKTAFEYEEKLATYNNAGTQELFRDKHFDADDNYNDGLPMEGAANTYWSDANPKQTIPSAEGYPYSRSLMVGMVSEAGGVGETFRIKNDGAPKRTVRTYFTKVAEQELIRVFGDEAPNSNNVRKIITVNPNNEISIQYVGKEGLLYATCLSGHNDTENLVDALASAGETFTVSHDFSQQENISLGDFGISSSYPIFIDGPNTKIDFDYGIDADLIETACAAAQFCSTCDYKVTILIHHEDGTNETILEQNLASVNCGDANGFANVFSHTIAAPGLYTIEKRVETNNLVTNADGVVVTSLKNELDKIEAQMRAELTKDENFGLLLTHLENEDLAAFWTEMGVDLQNPPVEGTVLTKPIFCGDLEVTFKMCDNYDCDNLDWLGYFDTKWAGTALDAKTGIHPSGYLNCFQDGNNYQITKQEFENFINNLLMEVDANGDPVYTCGELWNCWTGLVDSYDVLMHVANNSTNISVDLFDQYVNCIGKMYAGPIHDNSSLRGHYSDYNLTSAREGFIENAHKYFYYDFSGSTNDNCERAAQSSDGTYNVKDHYLSGAWNPGQDSKGLLSSNKTWSVLQSCVTNSNAITTTPDLLTIDGGVEAIEGLCRDLCHNKEFTFQQELIKAYHNVGTIVEEDAYTLILNDEVTTPYTYIYSDTPIDWENSPPSTYKSISEIDCQAISLVESCAEGCIADVVTNGNVTEVGTEVNKEYFEKIMNYAMDIQIGGGCGNDYNEITTNPDIRFDDAQTDDLRWKKVWDKSFGGSESEYTSNLKIKKLKDGNILLLGLTQSSNSGLVKETTTDGVQSNYSYSDIWAIKTSPSGTILWQNVIETLTYKIITGLEEADDGSIIILARDQSEASKDKTISGSTDWLIKLSEDGEIVKESSLFSGSSMNMKLLKDNGNIYYVSSSYDNSTNQSKFEIGIINNDLSKLIMHSFLGSGEYMYFTNAIISNSVAYVETHNTNFKWTLEKINLNTSVIEGTILLNDINYGAPGMYRLSGMYFDEERDLLVYAKYEEHDYTTGKKGRYNYIEIDNSNFSIQTYEKFPSFNAGHVQNTSTIRKNSKGNYVILSDVFEDMGTMFPIDNSLISENRKHNDFWLFEVDYSSKEIIHDRIFGGDKSENAYAMTIVESSIGDYYYLFGTTESNQNTGNKDDKHYGLQDNWLVKVRDYCTHESICFKWIEPTIDLTDAILVEPVTCSDNIISELEGILHRKQEALINTELKTFRNNYKSKCEKPANINDRLKLSYDLNYHHYMTYFYDRAGRKVRTVPPKGNEVILGPRSTPGDRYTSRDQSPSYDYSGNLPYSTQYFYNSLNNLTKTYSPDGGLIEYVYDELGRLSASQTPEQRKTNHWSYIVYDEMSRPIEAGQLQSTVTILNETHTSHPSWPLPIMVGGSKTEVVNTIFTTPSNETYLNGEHQANLQNRVSYAINSDGAATYYSYDVNGNVKWLIQKIPDLGNKYVRYEYDVLTNKVNSVCYNEGQSDQFYHQYSYDEQNRIKAVYTSRDGAIWDQDAEYQYYEHGPLERNIIGEDQVQGIDFVYTINGWIKGINHPNLVTGSDPGQDGGTGSEVGVDAFGMTLGYFQNDFVRTGSVFSNNHSSLKDVTNQLYNGNIGAWTANNQTDNLGATIGKSANDYRYDQLQRIKSSNFNNFNNTAFVSTTDYSSSYEYDANGNIIQLKRNANMVGLSNNMDDFTYEYEVNNVLNGEGERVHDANGIPAKWTNRLLAVTDAVATNNWNDLKSGQVYDNNMFMYGNDNNYQYDANGRLIKDVQEGISSIEWTVTNKVKRITKTDGSEIEFKYDPSGNRISKFVTGTAYAYPHVTSFYALDGTGNVMSNYETTVTDPADPKNFIQKEIPIYGSKRIGVYNELDLGSAGHIKDFPCITCPDIHYTSNNNNLKSYYNDKKGEFKRKIGKRYYQHEDHLGNVRVVFKDRKLVAGSGGFNAEIVSYNNYYPFGMLMAGRFEDSKEYRYGFNGAEKNEELSSGLDYDLGARMYNSRIGRMFSRDPRENEYPWQSTYAYFGNSPINKIDFNGEGDEDEEIEGGCNGGDCVALKTPNSVDGGIEEVDVVFVSLTDKWSWRSEDGVRLNSFYSSQLSETYIWDSDKGWYFSVDGKEYIEGDYDHGYDETFNPSWKGVNRAWDGFQGSINGFASHGPRAITKSVGKWWDKRGSHSDYWVGYWDLTDYQKGRNNGGSWASFIEGLPTMALTYGATKGVSSFSLGASLTVAEIDMGLCNLVTTADGYFISPFYAGRTSFGFNVQRFGGAMSGFDYFGPNLGSSMFTGRSLNAIWPHWNSLQYYTTGYLPSGSLGVFGIAGPQSFRFGYFGGAPQFQVFSSQVLFQTTSKIR